MFELKPISEAAIPRALAKAERYRLLGEPEEAESICRDILCVDEDNQDGLVTLLLAITDQFGKRPDVGLTHAQHVARRLRGEYERAYYSGLACERWVKAHVHAGRSDGLLGWLEEAMEWYRDAEAVSEPGNDDAILRWNACVRFLERNPQLQAAEPEQGDHPGFSDAIPPP
jgi:hypothetical protein